MINKNEFKSFDVVLSNVQLFHPSWSNPVVLPVAHGRADNKDIVIKKAINQMKNMINDIERYWDWYEAEGIEMFKIVDTRQVV